MRRFPWRILLCALAMACACGDTASIEAAGGSQITALQLRTGGSPPLRDDGATIEPRALDSLGGFKRVAIPDFWSLERRRRGLEGWYRARFELARPESGWGLAVDGSWDHLDVFVNGHRLAEITALDRPAPVALFANSSFLVAVPRTRLHAGANEVALHFRARPDEIGSLRSVALGPTSVLAAAQRRTALWTSTVPRLLALFALSCGLLVLLLARWSLNSGTLWFGVGTTLWASAALFAPLASSPSSPLGVVLSTAAHAFPPCIALGFLRALGLRRPRVERLLFGSVAIGAIARAVAAPLWVPTVDNLWWCVDAGIAIYALPLARRSVAEHAMPVPRIVFAATSIVVAGGLFDLFSLFIGHSFIGVSLFAATTPLIGVAAAAGVVSALAFALEQVRALNTELEQRVEEKLRELDASHARTALLERDRAIARERERMMRDMHDGTGGQFVSALAMVEGGEVPRDELAEALREALADLRLAIDSLEPGEPDLLALLAHARARLEPRLERHGLRFAWEVEDVPAPERFGPEQSLHVMRVFQEAVTNALKHAKPTTITVRTGTAQDAVGRALRVCRGGRRRGRLRTRRKGVRGCGTRPAQHATARRRAGRHPDLAERGAGNRGSADDPAPRQRD